MRTLKNLFQNNLNWSNKIKETQPDFFRKLATQQKPKYLWIGCSDSRVPANEIVGLLPGEIFVHRNVANVVVHTDFNCLSVIEYAVEVLQVEHIIVCGHYGCGGVQTAMQNSELGLIDNWLRHIKDVYNKHSKTLNAISEESLRLNRLCELNIIEQVSNVCHTTIVQHAWRIGRQLSVHGWVYGLSDGLLKDLRVCVSGAEEIADIYRMATATSVDPS